MNIKFHLVFDNSFVYINCSGYYDIDSMLKVYKSGIKLAKDLKLKKILFDLKEAIGATSYNIDRVIQGDYFRHNSSNSKRSINTAFVGSEPFIDSNEFCEVVNFNNNDRGKVFTDLDNAIKWLSKRPYSLFRKSA